MRILAVAILLFTAPAFAQAAPVDVWTDPNPGVRHLERSAAGPVTVHALVIDLSYPGVRVETTAEDERWQTVADFASSKHEAAAINGGFWGAFQEPRGLHVAEGEAWGHGDDAEFGFFAIDRRGRARISAPEEEELEPDVAFAVSGRPNLVRRGAVDEEALVDFPTARARAPRSAAGVSRDGTKVILVVIDGRQGHSRGASLFEVAALLVELGAYEGLNLDGGGSSTMYVAEEGGVINTPSGGRWEASLGIAVSEEPAVRTRRGEGGTTEVFVRGREREVMSHIGVVAPPRANDQPLGARLGLDEPPARIVVVPPRAPIFRIGRAREWIVPAGYGLCAMTPLALGLWIARRLRRAQPTKKSISLPTPESRAAR